jgi:hypothetical protein
MTMTILNLTPHPISLRNPEGVTVTLPPSAPKGGEPRVGNPPGGVIEDHPLAGIVAVHSPDIAGDVENLPSPAPGVFLVVSGMVGEALRVRGISRPDVLVPGTGPNDGAIREPALLPNAWAQNPRSGQIVAVTRLKVASP